MCLIFTVSQHGILGWGYGKMKIRLAAAAVLAGLLGGCSTTEQAGQALQSSWIGQPADNFFRQYGPPVTSYTLRDGGKIYEWVGGQASVYVPGSAATTTNVFGNTAVSTTQVFSGGDIYLGCKVRITTAQNGTIMQIVPSGDSLGMWEMSRCAELFVKH
jgi:hypothetical protein